MSKLLDEARALGAEHGRNAGTWAADGNTRPEDAAGVLAMIRAGDPLAENCLPRRPDLSGQFADDMTPQRLLDLLGVENGDADDTAALCEAYEDGVLETFEPSCERTLMAAAGEQ